MFCPVNSDLAAGLVHIYRNRDMPCWYEVNYIKSQECTVKLGHRQKKI